MATAVVAVALIFAGFAASALQRASLVDAIDTALTARVDDLGALIADGAVPARLAAPGDDAALIQIVDASGTVIASTANIEGEEPITNVQPASGAQVLTSRVLPIGEGEFRLLARTTVANDQMFTIYAASDLEQVTETVATLTAILVVGIPLLIGFVAITVWVIVGRTLHPVEAIRSQVASIGDRELDRRVPVPDIDDEIGRLASTMNQMLDRLEQASNQQRAFVADASHELRSPLAAIRSQLEVNLAHPQHADWPASEADVLDETLRMQRLVDDLLLLARSDSGTLPTALESVDLDDLIFEQVKLLESTRPAIFDTTGVSGAQVLGDPIALSRVARNLLENAVRYATSRVEVSLNEEAGTVTFAVDDDGPGIPAADRARVFDRFTRLDKARDRDHGGVGLGLAIAKEIVTHHGGTITIDEGPLGGAKVTLVIPASLA